ncbi:HK97 family phage prohead protease [Dokdonella sp.]|uniref:HK97 family phage prohead protease n=1 Tax=Dokdonella sp. TaxID=2291710 RepID=UPI0035287448
MFPASDLEIRTTAGLTSPSPGRLAGYAAVFDSPADFGEFTETVRPGAFTRALAERGAAILALYDHERRSVLGRTGAGTLKLKEDARGLAFELDLPDTSLGRDLAVMVGRGDVNGCSFAFRCYADGDAWSSNGGRVTRELRSVELHEITITPQPAYANTEVALRSRPVDYSKSPTFNDTRRAWLETCR